MWTEKNLPVKHQNQHAKELKGNPKIRIIHYEADLSNLVNTYTFQVQKLHFVSAIASDIDDIVYSCKE